MQAIGAVCDGCGEVRTLGVGEPLGRHWVAVLEPDALVYVIGEVRYQGIEKECGQWRRFSAVLPPEDATPAKVLHSDPMAPRRAKRAGRG